MAKRFVATSCVLFVLAVSILSYWLSDSRIPPSVPSRASELVARKDSAEWYSAQGAKRTRGVALVVHGLNLRPERMQPIIAELNDAGMDVLNVSLRGHGGNFVPNANVTPDEARLESFRGVTYGLWLAEVHASYLKARERASRRNVPVFFIGYSLGGLLGCDLVLSQPDVHYERMALFAPALNVTVKSYLLKALMPFPDMVIDSLSPRPYRTNQGTPMAAYKALFEAIDFFHGSMNGKLNKPTIVFIDEEDEFISYSELKELTSRRNLDRWRIHTVRKDRDIREGVSHHLIIDEESVGEDMWKRIRSSLRNHLTGRSAPADRHRED